MRKLCLAIMLVFAQFVCAQNYFFDCVGGEKGYYLSHANGRVQLQKGIQGDGEAYKTVSYGNGKFALMCAGGEKGYYLSHANGKVFLQNGIQGDGELWKITTTSVVVTIEALGGEKGYYLSHAYGKVFLQKGVQGDGERWLSVTKKK